MYKLILATIILVTSACHYVHYLDMNKVDKKFDQEKIYGSYSSFDKYTSGEYTLYKTNRYLFTFRNCLGKGQEVGLIKFDGRHIWLIADSSFTLETLKQKDTIWESCNFVKNFYYFDGGLHDSNPRLYYKESNYHK